MLIDIDEKHLYYKNKLAILNSIKKCVMSLVSLTRATASVSERGAAFQRGTWELRTQHRC